MQWFETSTRLVCKVEDASFTFLANLIYFIEDHCDFFVSTGKEKLKIVCAL